MKAVNVPVTIEPQAEALVKELGYERVLEEMLEQVRQMVPGLQELRVTWLDPYDTGIDPGIGIEAITNRAPEPDDRTGWRFGEWKIKTYPPEVWTRFTLMP